MCNGEQVSFTFSPPQWSHLQNGFKLVSDSQSRGRNQRAKPSAAGGCVGVNQEAPALRSAWNEFSLPWASLQAMPAQMPPPPGSPPLSSSELHSPCTGKGGLRLTWAPESAERQTGFSASRDEEWGSSCPAGLSEAPTDPGKAGPCSRGAVSTFARVLLQHTMTKHLRED